MISEHDRQVLQGLPSWNPVGDIAAQRCAWEQLAVIYNQDLPTIGALEQNVELRTALRADVAVPRGAGRIRWSSICTAAVGRLAAQGPFESLGCSLPKRAI
jgi:hypothetical protein